MARSENPAHPIAALHCSNEETMDISLAQITDGPLADCISGSDARTCRIKISPLG
jgi:hypothetical protein